MAALTYTTYDGQFLKSGTTAFIAELFGASAAFLVGAAFLIGGVCLLYSSVRRTHLTSQRFILYTSPLMFYIGATIIYTFERNITKSGDLFYICLYLMILGDVKDRQHE